MWRFIGNLKRAGKTILLTTHYLDEAEAISDEIAIISKGALLKVGTISELKGALSETVRVDIASDFSEEELALYGRVTYAGNIFRVVTNDLMAAKLANAAIARKVRANVLPISLDDVFISLVGVENDGDE